jgi:hypothetical protein
MPTVTTLLRGLTVARAVAGLLAATAVLLTAATSVWERVLHRPSRHFTGPPAR